MRYWRILQDLLKKKKGIKAAEALKKRNIDVLVVEKLSEGPKYVLGTAQPEGSSLKEIIINASTKFLEEQGPK